MRYLAILILSVGLSLGVLGAATAYSPALSLPDERLVGLTLAAPAGGEPGKPPLATADAPLTPELLSTLRAAGVRRVRVEQFGVVRWSGLWLFVGGMALLTVGAATMRAGSRRHAAGVGGAQPASAESLLGVFVREVADLRAELASLEAGAARDLILERVGGLQRGPMEAFVDAARRDMVAAGGLRLFANVIDRYSAAERRLNRCWSAAADGYLEESLASLDEAAPLLDETRERMTAKP